MKKIAMIALGVIAAYAVLVISVIGWVYCDEEPWELERW